MAASARTVKQTILSASIPRFVAGAETLPLTEAISRSASTLAVKALAVWEEGGFGWRWVRSMQAAPCQRGALDG